MDFKTLYEKLCLKINEIFPKQSEEFRKKYEKERKKKLDEARKRYRKAEEEFEKVQAEHGREDVEYIKAYKKYTKAFTELIKVEDEYNNDPYALAIKFARIGLEPYQIFFASQLLFIILFTFMMLGIVIVFIITHNLISTIAFSIFAVLFPTVFYLYLVNYPLSKAKQMRIKTLGYMPEAISYLVMSLYLTPSLERAVAFASENLDEPLSSDLKKVLWKIYLRETDSVEEAFMEFSYEWGKWNDSFKRALYAIRTSTLRSDEKERRDILEKASEIMMQGSRRDLIAYADALYFPTMLLFSLGVMLPLLLASLLPIMPVGEEYAWAIALVFDFLIPFFMLWYALKIVGEKPVLSTPPQLKMPLKKNEKYILIAICLVISAVFIYIGILNAGSLIASIYYLMALSIPLAIYLLVQSIPLKSEHDFLIAMNEDFPDALFQIGSRVAEGEPFESAMKKVVKLMRGTAVEVLFRRILYSLRTTRKSVEEILFGRDGILKERSTKMINTSMKVSLEAINKDPQTAGNIITSVATHLRELKGIERDMKNRLASATGMMRLTSLFFAPITIAVTLVLYSVILGRLEQITPLIPSESPFAVGFLKIKHTSAYVFSIIMVIYLFLTTIITGYFHGNIMNGDDPVQNKMDLGIMLIISSVVYAISLLIFLGFFGGYV